MWVVTILVFVIDKIVSVPIAWKSYNKKLVPDWNFDFLLIFHQVQYMYNSHISCNISGSHFVKATGGGKYFDLNPSREDAPRQVLNRCRHGYVHFNLDCRMM